ncbi:hypothetical protein K3152_13070 [Qipengyuania sp. 1NDH17]|uniref:Uncharacterized protein n=1 Tax=Qipengyuania polymorpha TaxID=2867234 RepID=A0ABS7J029_9SPHN|nr:hypothetical protein [Qipengyuania polymorpha]MBX7459183.1 hypothetical protein [Qipengyuania polymorpha]
MSDEAKPAPSAFLAEHLARKGPEELDKMQATIDLARKLLASGEVEPYADGHNLFELPPYPWEVSEVAIDLPRCIFLGTVSDLATGTGHTVYFAAGLARDEDEFRRQLAAHIGHTLANGATVKAGLGNFPFSKTLISHPLRQKLQKFHEGRNAPASFFYLGQWHENRS